jgi:hypothetical protein
MFRHPPNSVEAPCEQEVGVFQTVATRANGTANLLVTLILVSACSQSGNSTSSNSMWDPSAIKLGEKDYPTLNVGATKIMAFKANVPSSLKIRFEAYYSASPTAGGSPDSGESCQRKVGLAVTAPYVLAVPLELARDGESVSGSVVVDRYQPGRCDWSLQGIRYVIEDGWPPYNALRLTGISAARCPTTNWMFGA